MLLGLYEINASAPGYSMQSDLVEIYFYYLEMKRVGVNVLAVLKHPKYPQSSLTHLK